MEKINNFQGGYCLLAFLLFTEKLDLITEQSCNSVSVGIQQPCFCVLIAEKLS